MIVKCFKINSNLKWILPSILCLSLIFIFCFYYFSSLIVPVSGTTEKYIYSNEQSNAQIEKEKKDYIKWFEFNVSYEVLEKTSKLDINSHQKDEPIKYNWIELISYLACKYGNNFAKFKQSDLDKLVA